MEREHPPLAASAGATVDDAMPIASHHRLGREGQASPRPYAGSAG